MMHGEPSEVISARPSAEEVQQARPASHLAWRSSASSATIPPLCPLELLDLTGQIADLGKDIAMLSGACTDAPLCYCSDGIGFACFVAARILGCKCLKTLCITISLCQCFLSGPCWRLATNMPPLHAVQGLRPQVWHCLV